MIKDILAGIGLVVVLFWLMLVLGFGAWLVWDRVQLAWRYLNVRRHVHQEADRLIFESNRYRGQVGRGQERRS